MNPKANDQIYEFRIRADLPLPTHLREFTTRLPGDYTELLTEAHHGQPYMPGTIDVTPVDNSGSHKESVSCTYKKLDDYTPIFAYTSHDAAENLLLFTRTPDTEFLVKRNLRRQDPAEWLATAFGNISDQPAYPGYGHDGLQYPAAAHGSQQPDLHGPA